MREPRHPWNLNIHYDGLLARLVPPHAMTALDVGCGDGFLTARLAEFVPTVVGLDRDGPVVDRARGRFPAVPVAWLVGDLMTAQLPAFDVVVSNATLHHFPDTARALRRLGGLVSPGGRLAVVTFVRLTPPDLAWQSLAWLLRGVVLRMRGNWEHSAPQCWPPRDTFGSLRATSGRVLPGSRLHRLAYGRVLLTWDKPG